MWIKAAVGECKSSSLVADDLNLILSPLSTKAVVAIYVNKLCLMQW